MTPAVAWRWCAAAGVVACICSWGLGRIPGLVACGPSGGLGPILAFEFARTPADVAALFGSEPCRSTLVQAQTIGLLLDAVGFIPAYTAFLVLAALACAPATTRERIALAAVIGILLVAGVADEIEGALLYRIIRDLPGDQVTLDALWWPVHIKFALLSLGTIAIGTLVIRNPAFIAKLTGAVVAVSGLFALRKLLATQIDQMMIGFTIGWVAILLAALLASIRPSLFAVP